jgi:hypothetical protein
MKFTPEWKTDPALTVAAGDLLRVLVGESAGIGLGVTVNAGAGSEGIQIAVLIPEADGAVSLRFCATGDVTNPFNFGPDWHVTMHDLFMPHVKRPPADDPRPLIAAVSGRLGIFISVKSEAGEDRVRMIDLMKFEVANVVANGTVEYFPWSLWLPDVDAGFGPGNPVIKVSCR